MSRQAERWSTDRHCSRGKLCICWLQYCTHSGKKLTFAQRWQGSGLPGRTELGMHGIYMKQGSGWIKLAVEQMKAMTSLNEMLPSIPGERLRQVSHQLCKFAEMRDVNFLHIAMLHGMLKVGVESLTW